MIKMIRSPAHDMIRQVVSKIERLNEEHLVVKELINDVYKEAKSAGFDVKVLRKLISIRTKDQGDLFEQQEILELYQKALGMGEEEIKPHFSEAKENHSELDQGIKEDLKTAIKEAVKDGIPGVSSLTQVKLDGEVIFKKKAAKKSSHKKNNKKTFNKLSAVK